jgi:WD40 repeat protein
VTGGTSIGDATAPFAGRVSGTAPRRTLDEQNPWPGLESFLEGDADFFRGRDEQAEELSRVVRRERLVVLHGLSGLGKSSLLQAGLFPRLRRDELFLPVYIRIVYGSAVSYREQILGALRKEAERLGIDPPAANPNHTLWEHFHQQGGGYWTRDNRFVVPVIAVDQFEEAFTSQRDDASRSRIGDLLEELGDLIEGRMPSSVEARLASPTDVRAYDVTRHDYKIVLGIREDFLAQLETLGPTIPSVMGSNRNRMRLEPLRGDAATLVVQAGGPLVSETVGERIVHLVADAGRTRDTAQLHDVSVDPALLSLFCRELNERRKLRGLDHITPDLIEGTREDILAQFYARTTSGYPGAWDAKRTTVVRRFIEHHLIITEGSSSFRTSEPRARAKTEGVDDATIDALVSGRLIRVIEVEGQLPRIELTHDVLADVVRKSLDARLTQDELDKARAESERASTEVTRQRAQIRRSRMVTGVVATIALVAIGALGWAWRMTINARNLRATSGFRSAGLSAALNAPIEALGWLVGVIREQPDRSSARGFALALLRSSAHPSLRFGDPGIVDVAFSPDGGRVVSASNDNTARIWDLKTGASVGPVLRHAYRVASAAFSPDGGLIVTASGDSTAQIWNSRTGQPIGLALRHTGPVVRAFFSDDGSRVVTASSDSTARVWDATTGAQIRVFRERSEVNDVGFSPDGNFVVVAADGAAHIWSLASGDTVGRTLAPNGSNTAAFSPDGREVLLSVPSKVWFVNVETREIVRSIETQRVYRATLSKDGRRLVTAAGDSTARVRDAKSGEEIGLPLIHDGLVAAAAFSPDGRTIVSAGTARGAFEWPVVDAGNLDEHPTLGLRNYGRYAEFSPDGSHFVEASDTTAEIWETAALETPWHGLRHRGPVFAAKFSADGTRIVTASWDSTAQIWDAGTGARVGGAMLHQDRVNDVAFSPDGKQVATASGNIVRLWDSRSGESLGEFARDSARLASMSYSPDGREILTADASGTARLWDVATRKSVDPPMRHRAALKRAVFSADGSRIVTSSDDSTAQVWDAHTGAKIGPPMRHRALLWSARFSPDGKRLVTASADSTAQVWDAATGASMGPALRHSSEVIDATFSPDGKRIITASILGALRAWDAVTSQPVGPTVGRVSWVHDLAFSPNGKWLVDASGDSLAGVWDVGIFDTRWHELYHRATVNTARFSRDGKQVVTAGFDSVVQVWDANTGERIGKPLRHADRVLSADFSPDGRYVVTGAWNHVAQVWDYKTGGAVGAPMKMAQLIRDVRYSPFGDRIVTASNDGTAQQWDAKTQTRIGPALVHGAGVVRATYSADGTRILTASDDGSARVWDARTGTQIGASIQTASNIVDATYSPDGQRIATGSTDGSAQVWEAATGMSLGRPQMHAARVWAAKFSPDGQHLLTTSEDRTLRLWDVPTGTRDDATAIADVAEAAAWRQPNMDGVLIPITPADRNALVASLRAYASRTPHPDPDSFASFVLQFVGDTTAIKRAP